MDFTSVNQDEAECKASSPQPGMRSVFEFDDDPQDIAGPAVRMRPKSGKNDEEEDVYFVQFPKSPTSNGNGVCLIHKRIGFICFILGRSSAEVKRATIVGNPMFSADENIQKNSITPPDLAGLDDLQLDMDYDQIMHYFENLKVGSKSIIDLK